MLLALALPAAVTAAAALAVDLPDPDLAGLDPAVVQQLVQMRDYAGSRQVEEGLEPEAVAEAVGELGRLYHAYQLRRPAEACYRARARSPTQDHPIRSRRAGNHLPQSHGETPRCALRQRGCIC